MADYSSSTKIDVAPDSMHSYASGPMKSLVDHIAASWQTIGETWDGLKLGWIGDGADAASKFNADLKGIQERLFGVPSDDGETVEEPGLLDELRYGVLIAAGNYGNAENSVFDMWHAFCEQLGQEPAEGTGEPAPYQDTTLGPITADYNDNPYPYHQPEED